MARWVTEHRRVTRDNEELRTIVIFEPEIKKRQIERMNRYTKKVFVTNVQSAFEQIRI